MDLTALILLVTFVGLLILNLPVAHCIALATLAGLVCLNFSGNDLPGEVIIAQKLVTGIDSFPLLAIPFFIFSGLLMGSGGIATRLVDFVAALVGRLPGGLAYVNVLACMLFGSISGSAAAAVSSVGGMMIPEMNRKGYDRDFNVALTTTSAITGLMLPPSNAVIVYAIVAGGVSIPAMFVAGILPGLLFGICLMAVGGYIASKKGYGGGEKRSLAAILVSFKRAILSLLLVIIVLGGILAGIFTPTEAAAIAVAWAFFLAVILYRQVKIQELPALLLRCAKTTSIVMFLIGASMAMSWLLTYQEIPQSVSHALLSISDNKIVLLLLINVLLLFVGAFMDMTPAILIFTPIFLPVVTRLGIDPIHFGMIMVANLSIGLCSPPVGTSLFVGCSVGKTSLAKVTPYLIPLFIAMIVALMIVSFFPQLSLWLPGLLGLTTAS
jgi:tripartite ATP-independent transporter DctM subunit